MFATVAKQLALHIAAAEERCQAFEEEARGMKRALRSPAGNSGARDTQVSAKAAATWWWKEYMSLKDAISTLVDGKIRHEYDRPKAARTPNSAGIHWQKAGLRTGESQDNLRGLLKQAGSKHAVADFDALNRRLEDLEENLKAVRNALVLKVRAVRVSGWGEESQEFRFSRGGGGTATDIRLRPQCGVTLEECSCPGDAQPKPLEQGALRAAMDIAVAEAAAVVLEHNDSSGNAVGRDRGNALQEVVGTSASEDRHKRTSHERSGRAVDEEVRKSKKRRFLDGAGGKELPESLNGRVREILGDSERRGTSRGYDVSGSRSRGEALRGPDDDRGPRNAGASSSSSLDEIKRQMGKNPLDLERSRKALDQEIMEGATGDKERGPLNSRFGRRSNSSSTSNDVGARGEVGDVDGSADGVFCEGIGQNGRDTMGDAVIDDDGERRGDLKSATEAEGVEGESGTADWRDALMGMPPHERAEVHEERGLYTEALRWHRRDLVAARRHVRDGEDEDERFAGLDLARALRNTGRCLGRLGMRGFAQAKAHLTEAHELVGPDGPCSSPAEEQDVVLELGNLWYNRYVLCGSEGVRFFADEALEEAVRCYRECRELCVDLLADVDTNSGPITDQPQDVFESFGQSRAGYLLRADFNLGMALVEQKKHGDAILHLFAVGEAFRELTNDAASVSTAYSNHGLGNNGNITVDPIHKKESSDLRGLYASSLVLLGECLATSAAADSPSTVLSPLSRNGSFAEERRGSHRSGKSVVAHGAPKPLGASTGSPPGRLSTAIDTLEEAGKTFLDIGDVENAMDAVERLVKLLRLVSYDAKKSHPSGGGERYILRAEALCDRASSALLTLKVSEDNGDGTEHLESDLETIMLEIGELREHWNVDHGGRRSSSRTDENRNHGNRQQSSTGRREFLTRTGRDSNMGNSDEDQAPGAVSRSSAREASHAPESPDNADQLTVVVQRVGPVVSASGLARRRRPRALLRSTLGSRGGGRLANNRNGARKARSGSGPATITEAGSPSVEHLADVGGKSICDEPVVSESGLQRHMSGNGDMSSGFTGRGGDDGGASFNRLREAIVKAVGGGEERDARVPEEGGAAFVAYKDTVAPSPLVLSRLRKLSRPDRAALVEDARNTDTNATSNFSRHIGNGDGITGPTLDLRSCRLSDRELQVLLHAIMRHTGTSITENSVDTESLFSKLLLDRNPGVSAGGVAALWGTSGVSSGDRAELALAGDGGLGSASTRSLFHTLVHLDISRCGLTAGDLVGLAPPSTRHAPSRSLEDKAGLDGGIERRRDGGRAYADKNERNVARDFLIGNASFRRGHGPASSCALRVLVVSYNPLTRIGIVAEAQRHGEGGDRLERAARGMEALRELIARAPELKKVEFSGCSQLPDGPSSRLYSSEVSELFASALAGGLRARIVDITATSNGTKYADDDNRLQVLTLGLNRNRFLKSSWQRVLQHVSTHPPRQLDLAWAESLTSAPQSSAASNPTSSIEHRQSHLDTMTATTTPAHAQDTGGAGLADCSSSTSPTPPTIITKTLAQGFPDDEQDSPLAACSTALSLLLLPSLLASAVLPADAPGLEVLNLTGSVGLLLRSQLDEHIREASDCGEHTTNTEDPRDSLDQVSGLFRDALMSPVCRATHLMLSVARGPASDRIGRSMRVGPVVANVSRPLASPILLGPDDVRGFCEAASACPSLRCLDLAAADLSGPPGASAAVEAISCLLRASDPSDESLDNVSAGRGRGVEYGGAIGSEQAKLGQIRGEYAGAHASALKRLSFRGCRLGAEGLSAVLGAIFTTVLGQEIVNTHRHSHGSTDPTRDDGNRVNNENISHGNFRLEDDFGAGAGRPTGLPLTSEITRRRRRALSRLPNLLDLSDNRPEADPSDNSSVPRAGGTAASSGPRTVRDGTDTDAGNLSLPARQVHEPEDVFVKEIAHALGALVKHGIATVASARDNAFVSGSPHARSNTPELQGLVGMNDIAYIDLTGNGLASEMLSGFASAGEEAADGAHISRSHGFRRLIVVL